MVVVFCFFLSVKRVVKYSRNIGKYPFSVTKAILISDINFGLNFLINASLKILKETIEMYNPGCNEFMYI